ncbi:sulfotransferase domain-containing protein [Nereida sp. MMG025]|uniref:sulfotransferase domain-containing protein n=1 Tax=Nereida sp. MMG025 TaxID=2909981 RepID=UPI001F227438|nr:sulfotransferase domain-containing protein [Nereida sp. MMG025]MCF6444004.1 sulfotransferase domain-containing protein [Nereida sp. MMG025]
MIYSKGRKYLFVHAPKTGGTALTLALEDRAMADDVIVGDTPKAKARHKRQKSLQVAGRLWKHSTLRDIDGLITPEDLAQTFIVTLVRNPWDRAVSYYHWLREQDFAHPAVWQAKATTFERFITSDETLTSFRSHPFGAYVTDTNGAERCNAFVRLEHLAQDLAPFEAHLGFGLDVPRANASKRGGDYQPYFTRDSQNAIAQACAEDIARFGYSF